MFIVTVTSESPLWERRTKEKENKKGRGRFINFSIYYTLEHFRRT